MHEGAPLFQAIVTPYRSLSVRGLWRLFGVIMLLSLVTAAMAIRLGAWPVGGFTGAELALAALLFHLNARRVRATEIVTLHPDTLAIRQIDLHGTTTERRLPLAWLSVQIEERPGRVPLLVARTHERAAEIARHLGEAEKRDLAAALGAAIERLRNPRFDNPQLRDEPV